MQILKFQCKNQVLTLECPGRLVVAESRQHVYAEFAMDSEWDGLNVTAIFAHDFGPGPYAVQLTSGPVEIPPEALVEGRLRVSLEGLGDGGARRLSTAYMVKPIVVHRAGALVGLTPEEASPELWEQVLALMGGLSNLDTDDKSSLVAAINEVLSKVGTGGGGGGVDADEVEKIIRDYLASNPLTAADVGADPAGTAASQVGTHNTATDSHNDIRQLISGINDRLNAFFDSDDTTLDELSEIVAYIKSNKTLIEAVTTSKVSISDIIDNLTTNVANKPLSAAQGVVLKGLIDDLTGSLSKYALKTELPAVPVQSVNGKTGAVQLTATDVGARPSTWTPSASDVGADPAGTAASQVGTHNESDTAHEDIRQELSSLSAEIGDIETALDGIIALQNSYINGGDGT